MTKKDVDFIVERIKRPLNFNPLTYPVITPKTTPVIWFGDYFSAKACTISINPSAYEFVDKRGNILSGNKKRLHSRTGNDTSELTQSEAINVLKSCNEYFHNNPYWDENNARNDWFGRFNRLIAKEGFSYKDGSCVHLDLFQWATKSWGTLDKNIQDELINDDKKTFERLLNKDFKIMFLNGNEVIKTMLKYYKSNLKIKQIGNGKIEFRNKIGKNIDPLMYEGIYTNDNGHKILVIGWSLNLQNSRYGNFLDYDDIDNFHDSIIKAIKLNP
jgi:hypothetical protein